MVSDKTFFEHEDTKTQSAKKNSRVFFYCVLNITYRIIIAFANNCALVPLCLAKKPENMSLQTFS